MLTNLIQTEAVLFDLDGTLLDTAPDLAYALNQVLQTQGCAPLTLNTIRPFASHGAKGLLKIGLNIDETHPDYAALRQQLLDNYHHQIAAQTQLFTGMEKVLTALEQAKIPWGIVTNKPAWLTETLLVKLQLSDRAGCVVSGDTLAVAKPAPEPLWYAAKLLNVAPAACVYVGDAQRDIVAAKAAGMVSVLARYGYVTDEDKPEDWQADIEIANAEQLLNHINVISKLS